MRQIDEIIVVDNGPTADTEQVVSSFTARYVPEPHRGYATRAIAAWPKPAAPSFISWTTIASPNPIGPTFSGTFSIPAMPISPAAPAPGQPGLAARLEYLSTDGPVLSPSLAAGPARHLSTSNLILRRDVVEKVGCFDTTLTMCEDRDFTTRARKLGFRLRYEPKARVTHYPAISGFPNTRKRCGIMERERRNIFAAGMPKNPIARLFPASPSARLFLLPALAAAGTAYRCAQFAAKP